MAEPIRPDEILTPDEGLDRLIKDNRQRLATLVGEGFELDPIGLIATQINVLVDLLPAGAKTVWMTRVEIDLHERLNRAEEQAETHRAEMRKAKLMEGVRP